MWKWMAVMAVVAVVGCGRSPLIGAWAGDLVVTSACSDGTGGIQSRAVSWDITSAAGGLLSVRTSGTCGTLSLRDFGDHGDFPAQDCPVFLVGGVVFTPRVTAGTVDLISSGQPPFLDVAVQVQTSSSAGVCTSHFLGDLKEVRS